MDIVISPEIAYTPLKHTSKNKFISVDLECNKTVQVYLATTVTIECILGNVDPQYMESVAVSQGTRGLFKENGTNGVASSKDGLISLTYSFTVVKLSISHIQCYHDGVYTFFVNSILQDSTTLVVISK